VDLNKNVYTPEISPLYRERTTKMGPLNPEKCPVVGLNKPGFNSKQRKFISKWYN
jgi:hypothetical protein